MEVRGSHTVAIARERVWQLLTDHEVLARVTPGVTHMEPHGDGRFHATLRLGIGPLRGTFEGFLELRDLVEPETMTLDIEGAGGPGEVTARGHIRLEESDAGTTVHYQGASQLQGRLSRIGARLLTGVAKRLAAEFFKRLEREA